MERLNMQTQNLVKNNLIKIKKLFPNCITEHIRGGRVEFAVDFDKLRQELSNNIVEGVEERYQFTWPGKKQAILTANAPINKTLRPCREQSVDFDNTENIYIEGDNLDALKLLREDYLGKVKVIYIDPPYNTGNDFIYEDNFVQSANDYIENSGQVDNDGNHLEANTESNGRFHTDWLNMIYPRLKIAKDLLSDEGVIFISMDENESSNLQKVCNEIFGEQNYSSTFLWTKTSTPPALSNKCRKTVEYVLAYEKKKRDFKYFGSLLDGGDAPLLNGSNAIKVLSFPAGSIHFKFIENGTIESGQKEKLTVLDNIIVANGVNQNDVRLQGQFKWQQNSLNSEFLAGTYFIIKSNKFSIRFQRANTGDSFKTPNNNFNIELNKDNNVDTNESAVKELEALGLAGCFDYPKPTSLIEKLIQMVTYNDQNATILDFFSGSATTGQATLMKNVEDSGRRKFILVQLPEVTAENSIARKNGYKTICELGEDRLRRAGELIKKTAQREGKNVDVGFRVLKLDSSNMKDVYYKPSDVTNDLFSRTEDNIKEDRTDEDLLFQVMLELAVPLSAKIRHEDICGRKILVVDDNYLIACFDKDITDEVVTAIAKRRPQYFVMRDSSAMDDSVITNFETIFQTYSKDTVRKIL
jgi:adenine-specific DNA-methyltransferase